MRIGLARGCVDLQVTCALSGAPLSESAQGCGNGLCRSREFHLEDLIRIGAYTRGTNPQIDKGIELIPIVNEFLQQEVNQRFGNSDTRSGGVALANMTDRCATGSASAAFNDARVPSPLRKGTP
ncbi:MAG: hypothetical protein O3B13_26215 [Planctomycetota bacterium]|nr:hypothetical protein [Planctomycetota bacterium]